MNEPEEVATIPLVEERMEVGKRAVENARVRVRINVEEREQTVPAELRRDVVEARRVPRNVPVSELPEVRTIGDTMIIPVVEEQLLVEKRLLLVEEFHVLRHALTDGKSQDPVP